MRVKGRIKWKHLGAVGSHSTLKLERFDEELDKAVEILQLGEFIGASDDFAILSFDFDFLAKNVLWGPGKKGGVLAPLQIGYSSVFCLFHVLYVFFCLTSASISSGNCLLLTWKAKGQACEIRFQELKIEVTVRAFDQTTEELPRRHDGSSSVLLSGIEV